jgi:hypothetical protein
MDELIDFFTDGYGALILAGIVIAAPIVLVLWLNYKFITG